METEPADRFMDRGETPFGDFQKELEDIVRALRAWFYLGYYKENVWTYIYTYISFKSGGIMVSWRNGIMRGDRKFYLLVYTFQGCFIFF